MNEHAGRNKASTRDNSYQTLLPARLNRRAGWLLHQQCWAWGRDIRRAEGNLLLDYGFEKFRPPTDEEGSAAYRLDLSNDASMPRSLTLWGFGLYYASAAHAGGMFLSRLKFTPKLSATVTLTLPLWRLEQLPALRVSRSRAEQSRALRLLAETCAVVEAYERWVRDVSGREYRRRCLSEFKHTKFTPERAIAEWHAIGESCRRMLAGAPICKSKRPNSSLHRAGVLVNDRAPA